MSSLTAATPMLPKGTAAALAFATAATPAASFAQRIANRYLGEGSALAGLHESSGRGRLVPELAWVFPRAWYLDHLASRHMAVPRWYGNAASDDPLREDERAGSREAMAMPVVAGIGARAAEQGEPESARSWAAAFETAPRAAASFVDRQPAVADLSPYAPSASAARREPWLPRTFAAMATHTPLSLVHLAWSDAMLSQMVGAPSVAAQPLTRSPRDVAQLDLVVRGLAPVRRDVIGQPPLVTLALPPQRTPVFADDEEVSDDVFAAIARPPGSATTSLAPTNAREARGGLAARAAVGGAPQAAGAMRARGVDVADGPTPVFDELLAASMASLVGGLNDAPMSVRIRLADAQAARVAPHWFSSGEVDASALALARADAPHVVGRQRRDVPLMPPLATASAIASSRAAARRAMSRDVPAQAAPAAGAAKNSNEAPAWSGAWDAPAAAVPSATTAARHAPGARGYAAALQATELALGVAYLSMQFVTPGEAAVARAMRLAPALWTSGVTLAAAGDDAVAARWSALEQMALVSPARALAPEASPRLPRGIYAWPAAATTQWQRAAAADGAAGDDAPPPELHRAFAAVWGEAELRERLAAQHLASDAGYGAPGRDAASDERRLARDATQTSLVALAPTRAAVRVAGRVSPVSAMPLPHVVRHAAVAGAATATATVAASAAERAAMQAWPATYDQAPPAAYAGDAASRMLVALTAGVPREALPASVLTWVSQLEVAVANEQRAARHAPPSPAMPTLAPAGARHASEARFATSSFEPARETPQLARAQQAAELADLSSTYVVAGPSSGQAQRRGAERLRAEISSLSPGEIAALMQAAGQAPTSGTSPISAQVFGGASVALPAQWSDGAAASLAAGMAPALAGEPTSTEPSLYEMTMIAALNQAAPAALAARAAHEPAPAHLDAAGPAHFALDVEAEAQAVLREVLHLIHALRDRNGDF